MQCPSLLSLAIITALPFQSYSSPSSPSSSPSSSLESSKAISLSSLCSSFNSFHYHQHTKAPHKPSNFPNRLSIVLAIVRFFATTGGFGLEGDLNLGEDLYLRVLVPGCGGFVCFVFGGFGIIANGADGGVLAVWAGVSCSDPRWH